MRLPTQGQEDGVDFPWSLLALHPGYSKAGGSFHSLARFRDFCVSAPPSTCSLDRFGSLILIPREKSVSTRTRLEPGRLPEEGGSLTRPQ